MIYYVATTEGVIYLLMIYAKAEQDTLSAKEVEVLRKLLEG